jgi:undecaprenyl-diphosphatase
VSAFRPTAAALAALPSHKAVVRFDEAVDGYFEAHLRGRPPVDVLMYAASAAGEHSLVWLGLAGIEGWRSARSAKPLVRAAAALAAESGLVNGLVKLAFRRPRPERTEPPPLPLRTPRTSSFPSGHASAAFFAAALLRDSPAWPLYYALAAVVASSRVHVRIHHASDVVAGAALGAVLGELARHVVPIRNN